MWLTKNFGPKFFLLLSSTDEYPSVPIKKAILVFTMQTYKEDTMLSELLSNCQLNYLNILLLKGPTPDSEFTTNGASYSSIWLKCVA